MKPRTVQCGLRIPREVYEDALDVARVFDTSLNQFFLAAIRAYVEAQLGQEVVRNAVAKAREARQAGLVSGPDEESR